MIKFKNKIWISWETQRRSIELAKHLNCKLYIFDVSGIFRYPVCILKTLPILLLTKPDILFVQNPSIVLAAIACLCTRITKTKLIVDRHSNFRLNKPQSGSIPIWLFMRFHYYSLKTADLTVVTNRYIAELVLKLKGNPIILPDKLPTFNRIDRISIPGEHKILLLHPLVRMNLLLRLFRHLHYLIIQNLTCILQVILIDVKTIFPKTFPIVLYLLDFYLKTII